MTRADFGGKKLRPIRLYVVMRLDYYFVLVEGNLSEALQHVVQTIILLELFEFVWRHTKIIHPAARADELCQKRDV